MPETAETRTTPSPSPRSQNGRGGRNGKDTEREKPPVAEPFRDDIATVLAALEADPNTGLTEEEAARRRERYGPNTLGEKEETPIWKRILVQFQNPLTLLLLAATVISLVAWWLEQHGGIPYEALTILAVVLINAGLGYIQEARAEEAIASLQQMSAAHVTVLRGGKEQSLETEAVVPGDILILNEGDTVPADGRLLQSVTLKTAEAALTGESVPVEKTTKPLTEEDIPVGDRTNMVFRGSDVTSGHGKAVITGTGRSTELGKIAGLLEEEEAEKTPLQEQLDRVGKVLGIVIVIIAIVVAITIIFVQKVSSTTALLTVLIYAVSLAVSAVPEGLPVITTVVLSIGVQKMAKRNVVIRRLSAVETLGSATVICTDKTGTLTRNEMTVRAIVTARGRSNMTGTGYAPEGEVEKEGAKVEKPDEDDELKWVFRAALLDNNARLEYEEEKWRVVGDPTEGALLVAARKAGLDPDAMEKRFQRKGEIPFSSERKRMSTLHSDADADGELVLLSKGAPDVLLSLCQSERVGAETKPLTDARRDEIQRQVEGMAEEALRTIGVAYRRLPGEQIPEDSEQVGEEVESDLVWVGAVGMMDPPRDEARDAVARAKQAGIRVVMATGDHPVSALAVAKELGIAGENGRVVTGSQLDRMGDDELAETIHEVSVFARVSPEHKPRIVKAFKAHGDIVAMTGDGANDAPALKAADIGVAMGITGTDVAKGAADMILTDDNFATIVAAVEEGRAIYANIQKFLEYLLSCNVGEVLVMFFGVLLAGLLGLNEATEDAVALPLLATMILWINLVTDTAPALALGVEPADPNNMERPPRDPSTSVITPKMWRDIAVIGSVMAIGTLLVLDAGLPGGVIEGSGNLTYARTLAFTTLVFFQLFNVLNVRSDERSAFYGLYHNHWLWISIAVAIGLQVLVVSLPPLQKAFGTVPLTFSDWLLCTAVASSALWVQEILKIIYRLTAKTVSSETSS
ncbi:MAG: cation-translocating P-type ATPase [Armatimonadaceae bacterium]